MSEPENLSCRWCVKSHWHRDNLQCRAHPPRQDVGQYAVFPIVRPADYCHEYAPKALAVEALSEVVAAVLDAAGAALNPPAGDLTADVVTPNEVRAAEADEPQPRARRARTPEAGA